MGRLALILLSIIAGALLVGWILDRLGIAWGARLSLTGAIVARAGAGFVVAFACVQTAERGGIWFGALAILLGALALSMLAFAGLFAWALLKSIRTPE